MRQGASSAWDAQRFGGAPRRGPSGAERGSSDEDEDSDENDSDEDEGEPPPGVFVCICLYPTSILCRRVVNPGETIRNASLTTVVWVVLPP